MAGMQHKDDFMRQLDVVDGLLHAAELALDQIDAVTAVDLEWAEAVEYDQCLNRLNGTLETAAKFVTHLQETQKQINEANPWGDE